MKDEKRGFAIAAGVFLLLYGGILFLLEFPVGFLVAMVQGTMPLAAAAGVCLILRKQKIAAVLMSLAAVLVLVREIPEIPRYLEPNGYLATFVEEDGYAEYIPRAYVVLPILSILAALCLAAALYLRGVPALALAVLAAAAELAFMVLQIKSVAYITGHPTPFQVFFPFNYAVGALFAGFWLNSLKKQEQEKP